MDYIAKIEIDPAKMSNAQLTELLETIIDYRVGHDAIAEIRGVLNTYDNGLINSREAMRRISQDVHKYFYQLTAGGES